MITTVAIGVSPKKFARACSKSVTPCAATRAALSERHRRAGAIGPEAETTADAGALGADCDLGAIAEFCRDAAGGARRPAVEHNGRRNSGSRHRRRGIV